MNDSTDADLLGIYGLLRMHIEIRNRSWMKRVHKNCFIGATAVDFLVTQGLADNRGEAVKIGQRLMEKKMIRHVSDSFKFRDAYLYYRFKDDEGDGAQVGTTCAGNSNGTYIGEGGCKFSFSPHTAHNSFIMDIALAQELERAIAGPSVESRAKAIEKLRARVKEQASSEAPDWQLTESTEVNGNLVSVYARKRPRGDFKNIKMTGLVAESPKDFIRGILGFDRRKQWESMFEDGVVVEKIDIDEISPFYAGEAGLDFSDRY